MEPNEPQRRVRQTLSLTLDAEVLAEIKELAYKHRSSVSREVERALAGWLDLEQIQQALDDFVNPEADPE